MRRTNAAGHDRTTRPELRCADLPVHALRLRREFPEGTLVRVPSRSLLPVQHGNACLGQHGSFVAHFDQAEAGQNRQIFVADGRHFQPARLYVPQCPAETDSPLEAEFSKGIVHHSRSIIGPPGSDLSCCDTSLGAHDNASTAVGFQAVTTHETTSPLSSGARPPACAPGARPAGCIPQ